jgi:hypothetical protein
MNSGLVGPTGQESQLNQADPGSRKISQNFDQSASQASLGLDRHFLALVGMPGQAVFH